MRASRAPVPVDLKRSTPSTHENLDHALLLRLTGAGFDVRSVVAHPSGAITVIWHRWPDEAAQRQARDLLFPAAVQHSV